MTPLDHSASHHAAPDAAAPWRCEADALASMLSGLERRVDAHSAVIGHDGEDLQIRIANGVRDGFRAAVSDPEIWSAAREAALMQTRQAAGGWLLGGLQAIGSRLLLLLVLGGALYLLGGWQALVTAFKAATGADH